MTVQGKLFNICSSLGNYRNLFIASRITVAAYQQQNTGLKTKARDKLKDLKIPEPPKRPLTPYFRFLAEHRQLVLKKHPDWKVTQISKQCAEDWKTVQPTIKEKYQQEYTDELVMYDRKNKEFSASLTEEQIEALSLARKEKRDNKEKRVTKKRWREHEKPKRPVTSFLFFIKEKWALPENKNKKLTEMLTTQKDIWHSMVSTEKEKYIAMHKADKKRYEKEMAEWEIKMIKEGNVDIVRKDSRIITSDKPLHVGSSKQQKSH